MKAADQDRKEREERGIALAPRNQQVAVLGDANVPGAVPDAEEVAGRAERRGRSFPAGTEPVQREEAGERRRPARARATRGAAGSTAYRHVFVSAGLITAARCSARRWRPGFRSRSAGRGTGRLVEPRDVDVDRDRAGPDLDLAEDGVAVQRTFRKRTDAPCTSSEASQAPSGRGQPASSSVARPSGRARARESPLRGSRKTRATRSSGYECWTHERPVAPAVDVECLLATCGRQSTRGVS